MPFHSKKQSSACFATGGFGGKVDCEEWASKTNYKKLPKRKHKKFKEWLEENHKEILDENWLGKLAGPLAIAGGLMGGMPSTAQTAEQPAQVQAAPTMKPDISKATDVRDEKEPKLGNVKAYWLNVDGKNTWIYVDGNNNMFMKKRGNFSQSVYSKWLDNKGKWSNWLSKPELLK